MLHFAGERSTFRIVITITNTSLLWHHKLHIHSRTFVILIYFLYNIDTVVYIYMVRFEKNFTSFTTNSPEFIVVANCNTWEIQRFVEDDLHIYV